MIDYNEDRRQLQVDRLIEDFIADGPAGGASSKTGLRINS